MTKSLSIADLEALPDGSAVLRNDCEVFIACTPNRQSKRRLWGTTQSAGSFASKWMADGMCRLLWKPTA